MAYEHPLPSESPRLDREAIIQTRLLLLDLAGRLRSDPDVDARGVARATRLIEDPSGPLYVSDGSARMLAGAARAAIAGLD